MTKEMEMIDIRITIENNEYKATLMNFHERRGTQDVDIIDSGVVDIKEKKRYITETINNFINNHLKEL